MTTRPVFPLPVTMLDEPLHTDEHPYCDDSSCPCQQHRERFTVKTMPDITFEYDRDSGSPLRIAWSGNQVFLTRDEVNALHDLLNTVTM